MKTTLCCLGNSLTAYNVHNVVTRVRTPTSGKKSDEQSVAMTGNKEEVNGLDNNPQVNGCYLLQRTRDCTAQSVSAIYNLDT